MKSNQETSLLSAAFTAAPQRMLSQRILLMILSAKHGQAGALEEAEQCLQQFTDNHAQFNLKLSQTSAQVYERVNEVLFGARRGNSEIENFIKQCRMRLADLKRDAEPESLERELYQSSGAILQTLEEVVEICVSETFKHIEKSQNAWQQEREELHKMLEQVSKVSFEFSIVALNARVLAAQSGGGNRVNDQRAFSAVSEQMSSLAININDLVKKALERPKRELLG